MSNRQSRRQAPRTGKRLGLPKSNLQALQGSCASMAYTLTYLEQDADALEMHVHREDRRSQSIIRQMRRVASFYQQLMQER